MSLGGTHFFRGFPRGLKLKGYGLRGKIAKKIALNVKFVCLLMVSGTQFDMKIRRKDGKMINGNRDHDF